MADIYELLEQISSAIYGEDVRGSIHDAIEQCYEDATGNPDSLAAIFEKLFNGAIGGIGDIVNGVNGWGTDIEDIATLTSTKLNSIYLKPGTWLLLYNVRFSPGANETADPYRVIFTASPMDVSSSTMPVNYSSYYGEVTDVLGALTCNGFYVETITEEDATVTDDDPAIDGTKLYYLYGYHNGAKAASANSKFIAIRLKANSEDEDPSLVDIVAQNTADISLLNNASLELDEELVDIRTGAAALGGIVYESAGDAVRGQVTDLKSDLADISESTRNLFDKSLITIGLTAKGLATGNNRALSGPMKVDQSATIQAFNLPSNIKYEIDYYSGEDASTNVHWLGSWITDENTHSYSEPYDYVRILFGTVNNGNFSQSDFDDLIFQVEKGSGTDTYIGCESATDIIARESVTDLKADCNINLLDKNTIKIGLQATGLNTNKNRALSGPMRIDGEITVQAINLPSNIKYEIEFYSGVDASTYVSNSGGWISNTNERSFMNGCTYARLLFATVNSNNFSPSDFDSLEIVVKKGIEDTNNYFKVCTWNTGLWYNGNPHGMDMDLLYKWYRVIGKIDADVFLTQESPLYLDSEETMTFSDLMGFKYDNIELPTTGDGVYLAKGIASKHKFFGLTKTWFSVGSRYYYKFYTYVNGKKVCIYNTHLTVDDDYRPTQITELVTDMSSETNVICCGDFNPKAKSELTFFTTAGFKLANCGMFGDFITCPNDQNNKMLDNCIVSPNISIQSVEAMEGTGSDHISDHVALLITLRV